MSNKKLIEAARRGIYYMDLWKQSHPKWNGNHFDDDNFVRNAITEAEAAPDPQWIRKAAEELAEKAKLFVRLAHIDHGNLKYTGFDNKAATTAFAAILRKHTPTQECEERSIERWAENIVKCIMHEFTGSSTVWYKKGAEKYLLTELCALLGKDQHE